MYVIRLLLLVLGFPGHRSLSIDQRRSCRHTRCEELMLFRLLCAVLMMGAFAGQAQAATLFSSTFEGSCGTILATSYAQSYSGWPCTGGPMSVVTSPTFAGSQSLRLNYLGTEQQGLAGGFADFSWGSTSSEIWLTFYNRMDSGFVTGGHPTYFNDGQQSVGTKGLYTFLYSSATGQRNGWSMSYLYGGRQLVMGAQGIKDARDNSGNLVPYDSEWIRHNIQAYEQPLDAWVCYEVHIRLNTPGVADGLYEQYATNITAGGSAILTSRHQNREFLDSSTSGRMPSDARWYEHKIFRQNGFGSMYYDNIQYTTTRVGCSGAPPPSDTTAPAQVAGLSSPSKTAGSISYTWTANTESDLQQYTIQGCTGAACTNFGTVGTRPAGQSNFTWTGLSANTLYRLRVAAQDTSNNVGSFSSIVDVTTNAATTLPTVTNFATSATGGTITYTGTPTDFRIAFGGTNGDGTFFNSQIIRTLAQVPAGVLSFNWPLGTSWACAFARDAVAAEDPINYRCNQVTPAAPGGGSSSAALRELSSNPRWLTLDGTTAVYRVGISGGDNCNASFCGLQDLASSNTSYGYSTTGLIPSTTISDTFDGTAADIGTSWMGGYTGFIALAKTSGVMHTSVNANQAAEARSESLFGHQFAKVTIQTITGAGASYMSPMVEMSTPGGDLNGYACTAMRNTGGTTSRIARVDAGTSTVLASESATTWASTDTIECRRIGKYIYLYRNGSLLLTATSTTYRNGRVGYLVYAATAADATVTAFTGGPMVADYVTNLDALVTDGGNWVRYWTMEQERFGDSSAITAGDEISIPYDQFPYQWTGTTRTDTSTGVSLAVPVYDVTAPNQAFYDRVVARADAALARGITPIITMFSGGHLAYPGMVSGFSNPFYSGNNINGISCDTNVNGNCEESHTLTNGNINNAQRQYVDRLVQAIGNRPVILEVSNEDQSDTTDWQNMIMERVRTAEATYSTNAHVIFQSGFAYGGLANSDHLFANSRNDAVSPLCTSDGTDWDLNPPANDGTKLIFYDSDHTGYADSCGTWTAIVPWRLFTRAIYPIYLSERESGAVQTAIKAAMAQTKLYSTKINLATAYPETGTSTFSTGFGLFTGSNSTTPNCSEYLMLMPSDGSSTINLSACSAGATFNVETLNLTSGAIASAGTTTGGASRAFNPAGSDPMVIYLKLDSVADVTAPAIISCTTSPAGVLPAGTTTVDITCTTDENATAKLDTSPGVAYASMATTFGTTGTTTHTQSVGSLADGTSYTRYVRVSDGTNPTTTDYPVAWSVAAAAVSTPPADVTGLRGTLNESTGTILWQWDAVAGADRYLLEISVGETFLTAVESSANSGTTYQQGSLTADSSYNARVKAINTANQQSVNWNQSVAVNTTLPPQMTGLTEATPGAYSNTVILSWAAPTNSSLVSAIERCTGAACTTFAYHGGGNTTGYTDTSVSPGTTYCYRGKFSNPVFGGTSASWSSTYCATTKTIVATANGLTRPRTPWPFGVYRLPRN